MKSQQMREDELNRAVEEDAQEINYLYANYNNYTPGAADGLGRMSAKHKKRQLAANEVIRRQQVSDELNVMGWAGCAFVIVVPLLCLGAWFFNTYPNWDSIVILFGW